MRSVSVLAISVLLMLAVPAQGGGQAAGQAGGAKDTGSAAITAVADAYVKAAMAGDAKAIAALYTEDAVEMPPNQPAIKGRAAIEQFYQKEFGSGVKMTSFTLKHLETRAMGDNGYDVGAYQQTMTPPGATAPAKDSGKYVVIAKRSAGAWKVAYAIYNSDLAPR